MRRSAFALLCLALTLLLAIMLPAASQPASTAASPANSTLLNELMAYWTMDETSGPRLDSSGRGNHVSEFSTVASPAGKIGNAAGFTTGGSEYLTHADNADLSQGNNDFTVAGWFYLHTKPPQVWGSDSASFFTKWDAVEHREYGLLYRSMDVPSHGVTADTFEFIVASDGTEAGTKRAVSLSLGGVMTDTWYFIVAWHDSVSDTINIQVNNGPIDSTAYSAGVLDSTSPFQFGRMALINDARLDGRVDEFGLWDRVLTPEERATLYNSGTGLTYPFGPYESPTPTTTPPTATPSATATATQTPLPRVMLPIVMDKPDPIWVTLQNESFQNSFPNGWEVFDQNTNNGHYYWGATFCTYFSAPVGGWAVSGGAGVGLPCDSNYPDHVRSWMISGPFDLVDATAAEFKLNLALNSELDYDGLCYLASTNNDNFYGTCLTGNSGGWIARTLDLSNVPGLGDLRGQNAVWVAVLFISDSTINLPFGAYVDDLIVRKCLYGACPPSASHMPSASTEANLAEFPYGQLPHKP